MSLEGNRRRKQPRLYDILLIPAEQGKGTRRLRVSGLRLWVLGAAAIFGIWGILLLVLIYTPVGAYVPIQNPELERKYGEQIVETQQRLNTLADEMMVLHNYNTKLRRALGEDVSQDTLNQRPDSSFETGSAAAGMELAAMSSASRGSFETGGDFDQTMGYNAVVTGSEGYRAAFPLLPPTDGYMTQGFEPDSRHFGIDYATKRGTPVYAATSGHVIFSSWTYDDGNMIILSHGGGYLTVYKHNQTLLVNLNSFVKRGEPIALVGTSGKTSLGPHLHFEVWKDGMPQDPNEYLLATAQASFMR